MTGQMMVESLMRQEQQEIALLPGASLCPHQSAWAPPCLAPAEEPN